MANVSVLCASGSLGLTPIHPESFWAAVEARPDAIVADAGSGDIGPNYLGADLPYGADAYEDHDLRLMLTAARRLGVPMVVGSAGGAGTDKAVARFAATVQRIAAEEGLSGFRLATIYSELDIADLARRAEGGRIDGLGLEEPLTPEVARSCSHVVGMMGVEPLVAAQQGGADVVIAGRACDDAVFAAVPIAQGCDRALSLHMGKTIECGPMVATPIIMREAIVGTVRDDDFLVEPFHPGQRCTPASVADHTLYERVDPYIQHLPGGAVDLHGIKLEAHTDRICRVSGSRWVENDQYKIKLEGSTKIGHRAWFPFGLRDPVAIANVDAIVAGITAEIDTQFAGEQDQFELHFHVYGRNAILQEWEPRPTITSHEICVIIEIYARAEELIERLGRVAKYSSFRIDFPGNVASAGGSAMLSDDILRENSPAYAWTVDHLLPVNDPMEVVRTEQVEL